MADEANLVIVAKMRDEATPKMKQLGNQVEETSFSAENLTMTLTATGAALAAVGSLVNQLDSPMAKTIGNFLTVSGAIMTTSAAIMSMMKVLPGLISSLRSLAVVQSILMALSGPKGWITLGIGAAVGVGATAGIMAATSGGGGGGGTTVNNITVQGSVVTEREVGDIARKQIYLNQDRNATSGIK